MTLRDERQKEYAKIWIEGGMFGILDLCPRFGKTRVAINIMKDLEVKRVLVAYPDNKIAQSWEDEFQHCYYRPEEIVYTTHLSIKKHVDDEPYDLVIIDEIHLLSDAQMSVCYDLFCNNERILGLSGSLSKWTKKHLGKELGIYVVGEYSMSRGIEEGIVSDYVITVIKTKLDDKIPIRIGKKVRTEKKHFDAYTYMINKMEEQGKDTKFLRLKRASIFQNSINKLKKAKEIIENEDERILVFCGSIKSASSLGISSYHSESESDEVFINFVKGDEQKLAVVKIGNSGITYKPLSRVVIAHFDSNSENLLQRINRCMSIEYDNPEKIAKIDIISTDEEVELRWLASALEFFDQTKIRYI